MTHDLRTLGKAMREAQRAYESDKSNHNVARLEIAEAAFDAALAAEPAPAPTKAIYRHKKRGTTYTYEGPARLQSEAPLYDMADLVIYRSTEGELWARPTNEFNDGRFELVSAAEPAPAPDVVCADGNPKCNDHLCHPICRWTEKTPAPDVADLAERLRDFAGFAEREGWHSTARIEREAATALETVARERDALKALIADLNDAIALTDDRLAAAEARVKEARRTALEEAARLVDDLRSSGEKIEADLRKRRVRIAKDVAFYEAAAAIRAAIIKDTADE